MQMHLFFLKSKNWVAIADFALAIAIVLTGTYAFGSALPFIAEMSANASRRVAQLDDAIALELSDYLWENRILLVFSPAATDSRHQEQMQAFWQATEGVLDRDTILVEIFPTAGRLDGEAIDESSVLRLREAYAIEPDRFTVILVGKDGWEKRRDLEPVSAAEIFAEIDAMPMRQREMQERGR